MPHNHYEEYCSSSCLFPCPYVLALAAPPAVALVTLDCASQGGEVTVARAQGSRCSTSLKHANQNEM